MIRLWKLNRQVCTKFTLTVEVKEYYVTETGENATRMVEKEVKVIGNGMVDITGYVDFDVEQYGINEKVSFKVLKDILETSADAEEIEENVKKRVDELVPKHIILDDIYATISHFLNLCEGVGFVDDIDHLGNRRIRSVGELLQNQFRIGFARMERVVKERMNLQSQDMETITPQALVNIRPITAAIKEFFGSSRFRSSWIRIILSQSLLIKDVFQHLVPEVFQEIEPDLRFVTYTTAITEECVLSKLPKDLTLV